MSAKPIELYTPQYYLYCSIGGALACGLTHAGITPLDVVKTNIQANPDTFKNTAQGFRLLTQAGFKAMTVGWAPTLVGYSIQGMAKYGLYEVFKHEYSGFFSEDVAHRYRDLIWLSASASAEFFADIGLCAFEATKVRVQTSLDPKTMKPTFARGLMDGMPKIVQQEGVAGLFKGLGPLWGRQIPYTMMKFFAFERAVEFTYSLLPRPKEEYNKLQQLGVSFIGGYAAGVFAAVVSQPADNVVSVLNKNSEATIGSILAKTKATDLFFKGLGPRIAMIGTLTALQWSIYDAFKTFMGFPVTGGAKKTKKEESK